MEICQMNQLRQKRNFLSTRRKMKVLSALNSSKHDIDLKDDSISAHGKELMTLLKNEQSYIEVLKVLKNLLLNPILKGNIESLNDIINLTDEMMVVHSNLFDVLLCGRGDLQDALKKLSNNMDSYISYSILINLESSNFQNYFEVMNHNKMEIIDLLHEPISHVFKYRTLLQNLYSASPNEVYNDILKAVENTCDRIKNNSSMRKNVLRTLQIQRLLIKRQPKILSPDRIILKEGILYKINSQGTGMKQRVFFLFNDILLCCKLLRKSFNFQENDSLRFSTLFPLNLCTVNFLMGSSSCNAALFKVTCGSVSYLLLSKVPGESQNWVQAIQTAISSACKSPYSEFKSKLVRRKHISIKNRMSPFLKKTTLASSEDNVNVQSMNSLELHSKPTSFRRLLKTLTCTQL